MAQYDILNLLRNDHDTIRGLQARVGDTSGNSSERRECWHALKRMLLAHADAEEKAFYETLTDFSPTRHTAEHSIEEHRAIEELITQCDHLGFDNPQWMPTFERLAHLSSHHLDEEETELFPLAGRTIDSELSAKSAVRYLELKDRFCTEYDKDGTTESGVRAGTYEARSVDALRDLAKERGVADAARLAKTELISKLRGAPAHDA